MVSDEHVYDAVCLLGLPKEQKSFDPFVHLFPNKGYVRIQGDILGEPVLHPLGFKLHSKDLLADRLDIYANIEGEGRIAQARAFIALTADDEKTKKYVDIWNRL